MRKVVEMRYQEMVDSGVIEDDGAQRFVVNKLDELLVQIKSMKASSNPVGRFWPFQREKVTSPFIKGIYLWGAVGRGKTFLMDLFYESLPISTKKRVHFHEFMATVHELMHQWRQQAKVAASRHQEPVLFLVDELTRDISVLCFDEFSVTDIADAMILGQLFSALFERGVVVVATSNVEPSKLYDGGLNRAVFLPFIAELQKRMDIVAVRSRTDFRLEKLKGAPVFYTPVTQDVYRALDNMFFSLTGHASGSHAILRVKGHELVVPQAVGGVARCSFSDMCAKAYGAFDYIVLTQNYHTLFLENVPKMDYSQRNEAKRFILLIDALYNAKVKLILSAECEVHELYEAVTGTEAFEFDRTVSRLIEMRSQEYLGMAYAPVSKQMA